MKFSTGYGIGQLISGVKTTLDEEGLDCVLTSVGEEQFIFAEVFEIIGDEETASVQLDVVSPGL